MSANKIILNKKVLIDLTADTVTENDVASGVTFHKADGTTAVGTKEEKVLIEKEITANGEYPASADSADGYSKVNVNVPIPEGYIVPEGSTTITENGEHNIAEYASVIVDVPTGDADTSDATATAADILAGKTAYANGTKLEGTISSYDGSFTGGVEITGGECSREHVIEVEELPTVGEEGKHYVVTKIRDVIFNQFAFNMQESISQRGGTWNYHFATTKPTNDIQVCDMENMVMHLYYIEDENNLFLYANGGWLTLTEMMETGIVFGGIVADTSDLPCDAVYVVGAPLYYYYVNGEYIQYNTVKKAFGFSSNGDGTCSIGSAGTYGTTRNIVIPSVSPDGDTVTMIGNNAFSGNIGIQTITISEGVKSNDYGSFRNCTGLTKVIFPDSYTTIANQTFDECYALAEVVLGKGIKSIGMYAFDNCKSLKTITYNGTVAEWGNITLNDNWNNNVPATSVTCSDGTVTL